MPIAMQIRHYINVTYTEN